MRLWADIDERAYYVPIMLFAYACVNQQDGDFTGYSYEDFARIFLMYQKSAECAAERYVKAMQKAGFFEKDHKGDYTLKIHDWDEWNEFHKRRSEAAKKAARARWAVKTEEDNPPLEPPPDNEKAPPVVLKNLTDQGQIQNQQDGAKRNGSGFKADGKREKMALSGKEQRIERLDKERQARAIQEILKKHPGRPDSTAVFPRAEFKTQADGKADFRRLEAQYMKLQREISGL